MEYTLERARRYEAEALRDISKLNRPQYHLTPGVGWMNDPNGFSFYKGKFHLFYQYYPYDTNWGKMHWGHAVSSDLVKWDYLPAALAPDSTYDHEGCFSGGAITLKDGRQMLMYTGVSVTKDENGNDMTVQQQCVAFGDGIDYKKYEHNPVIETKDLPEGASKLDFRDPTVFERPDGDYGCIVGSCDADKDGQLLEFKSKDGINWNYVGCLLKCNGKLGRMWECPNYFSMQGKRVLVFSPQEIRNMEPEFCDGNQTVCITCDEPEGEFKPKTKQCLDYGTDFYAPQVLNMPDGSKVMIGWLQNWDALRHNEKNRMFYGTMSIPRSISFKGDRLVQEPVKAIEAYRKGETRLKFALDDDLSRNERIKGRNFDMTVEVSPEEGETRYSEFSIGLAEGGGCVTLLVYDPEKKTLTIDRSKDGTERERFNERSCVLYGDRGDGNLKLRILSDGYTLEVFVNDGVNVLSAVVGTDVSAEGIYFGAAGKAKVETVFYNM